MAPWLTKAWIASVRFTFGTRSIIAISIRSIFAIVLASLPSNAAVPTGSAASDLVRRVLLH
jgi:hypothetical protein